MKTAQETNDEKVRAIYSLIWDNARRKVNQAVANRAIRSGKILGIDKYDALGLVGLDKQKMDALGIKY